MPRRCSGQWAANFYSAILFRAYRLHTEESIKSYLEDETSMSSSDKESLKPPPEFKRDTKHCTVVHDSMSMESPRRADLDDK